MRGLKGEPVQPIGRLHSHATNNLYKIFISMKMYRMYELSEYFAGSQSLSRVKRDENMMRWFATLGNKVPIIFMSIY